jgi:hypothetical protein
MCKLGCNKQAFRMRTESWTTDSSMATYKEVTGVVDESLLSKIHTVYNILSAYRKNETNAALQYPK